MGAIMIRQPAPASGVAQTGVTFVVHAPAAEHVELVGSFNGWQRGLIELAGPDATGRWTATVPLPEGRHEYMFLVDGERWVTDPYATFYRDDGFGNLNGVIDVESEAS
jgi:1,4-alpha-glucan branching enzyme